MVLLGFAIGLPLAVISVIISSNANWHPTYTQFGLGMMFNYVGSIAMALAYIGGVMWCAIAGIARPLQARLAAVGQMAFTNYILHSVICTFIFYGFGLGLFGAVERWAQMAVVVAIWAVQLILSPIWLRHFKFGPLEWAWRSLTYMRPQKMRV
jgi:uncharacterized protein